MTFEQLRLIDLLNKFNADMEDVYSNKNLSVFHGASKKLQDVYNFYITAQDDFKEIEGYLKNLFSSFNYAAVIINDGMKKKGLDKEANELLFECLQIMLKCHELIVSTLDSQGKEGKGE
ncbi:MAG TPA: hypothetical protein IAC67_07160 [Candidatus Coproplasma excrementipullorum]|nr:hypothetical protein [Candidatus Coproplasma excrementipullorum]